MSQKDYSLKKAWYAATSFILLIVPQIIQAQNSPSQSEFNTYAPGGPLEMVDLSTGNFRLNIPVLEIPGPEGNFELPLHYRAGIGLNQEASWVGLGWSMNAGAITRTVNQFPDDANGEPMVLINKNPGRRGWYARHGIVNLGWDSQDGHVGNVDVGLATVGWKNGLNSGSLAGVGYQDGQGATFDPMRFGMALLTVATAGTAGSVSAAMGVTGSKAAAIGVEVAFSSAVGIGVAQVANALHTPSSKAGGYNRVAQRYDKRGFGAWAHTNYWMFIDNNSTQKMYGPLYFHNLGVGASATAPERSYAPDVYKGSATSFQKPSVFYVNDRPSDQSTSYRMEVAADVSLPISPFESYQGNSVRPLSIAHDAFTVMAPGIGGSIRPYRLDVGSVAFPRQMREEHFKYNLVPFTQAKPEFIYEGSASNIYEHPQGTGAYKDRLGLSQQWARRGALTLLDPLLYDAGSRVAPARYGLSNGRLAQGRQVDWFTNEEIAQAGTAAPAVQGKFLDFAEPESYTVNERRLIGYTNPCGTEIICDQEPVPEYEDNWVTVPNRFRANLPPKGVGAFVITAEDGSRYHFALPVYHYRQHSKSWNVGNTAEYTSEKMGLANSDYAYATSWLLTAITGPDFVDKGVKGVLDAQDQGRWVKFEYGRFSSQFKWRTPYRGNATIDNGYTKLLDGSDAPKYEAYSEGYKETYYLNSISTRSHTALFVKDVRQDGRGHYTQSTTRNPDLNIEEKEPASSLKLSEIILLTNEDYQKLKADHGFGLNTNGNATQRNAAMLSTHDSFEQVFDPGDLGSNSAVRAYAEQRAIKRVVFNYSYKLCPQTDNSFASAKSAPNPGAVINPSVLKGKLTLESVALLGPNNAKLVPDFRFEYGFNPAYNQHKYDAYGFYKREREQNGSLFVNNTMTAINAAGQTQASEDGSAWSLKRLHNPLGSTLEVSYERDQYSRVSQTPLLRIDLTSEESSFTSGVLIINQGLNFDLRKLYKVGQEVSINGEFSAKFKRSTGDYQETIECPQQAYTGTHAILAVTATSITIANPPKPPSMLVSCKGNTGGSSYVFEGYSGFNAFVRSPANKNGGDLRVAKISVQGENILPQQTRYLYTNESGADFNSTGVVSKEPEKAKYLTSAPSLNPDYPATPVLYSEVTELTGRFRNTAGQADESAFDVRTVYSFHTPRLEMVSQTTVDKLLIPAEKANYPHYSSTTVGLTMANNLTRVNTALIGQPKWIRSFDKRGVQEREVVYNYTNDIENDAGIGHQGYFSEGVLLSELTKLKDEATGTFSVNKSIKTVVPTYLTGVTTTVNNVQTQSYTQSYDFLTTAPLTTRVVNSLGLQFRTVQTPAYKMPGYESMGPRALNGTNKHMLSQTAATSVSKVLSDGALSPVGTAVSTWKRDWATYRSFSAASNEYTEAAAPSEEQVFRLHRSFAWQGKKLNTDGTLAGFVPFNWATPTAGGQNAGWIQQAEITHYDHFSRPLQSKDINGDAVAEKSGYGQKYTIASAANARYTEIAYSGAEDEYSTDNGVHFGGEVRDGGRRSTDQKHTGVYSSLLTAGQTGFTYKAIVGNTKDVSTDRTYRASVWVYENEAASGAQLYLALNGSTVKAISIADATTKRAGKWLLLNLYLPLRATDADKQLTVGCRNEGSGSVYVDDFRFHPIDAPLSANVYDLQTWQLTYTLDNDNLYTHYEYDAAGKVIRVYREVLTKPGSSVGAERRLVKELQYNYAQMRIPNWVATENARCKTTDDGPTGEQEQEETDVNSASSTYGQTRWIVVGASPDCPTCTGTNRWIAGMCQAPERIECVESTQLDFNSHLNAYRYWYSDGSSFSEQKIESAPCALSIKENGSENH